MVSLGNAFTQGAVIAITIKAVDKFSNTFNKAGREASKLSSALKIGTVAVAAFGTALVAVGVSSLRAAADFEQTNVAFTTMLGSADLAEQKLNELADFAKNTPFTLKGVEKSARQLLAVGFEADDLIPILKDVGDVASGLGLGEEGLQRLILNLGQVKTQGKLTGRELRDFSIAGVPLLDELAKAIPTERINEFGNVVRSTMPLTTERITEMVSNGEIGFDVVAQAFKNMSSEGGKFFNLMDNQSETTGGKFSNLGDAVEVLQREFGQFLLPAVNNFADSLINDVFPALEPLIPIIGEKFAGALEKLVSVLTEGDDPLIVKLAEFAGQITEITPDIIEGLLPAVIDIAIAFEEWLPFLTQVVSLLGSFLELFNKFGKLKSPSFGGLNLFTTPKFFPEMGNSTSVQDAIIKPDGQVIRTSPQDTIIATKGGMGMTLVVQGSLIGLNEEDLSRRLSDQLNARVSL